MQRIGVVGLGLMGSAIVQRLLAAGFEVTGYDVDADKRARLAQSNAAPADSLAALSEQCTTIMLAVFNTDQVEAVIEGSDGLLSLRGPAKSRPAFICTSTCDPDRIAQLAARIESRADYIEMPVSGTSAQLAAGEGVGLVGGTRSAVEAATPVLQAICPNRQYLGAVGNGGKAKLAVNLVLGLNRGAIAEGLVFAEKMGLEPVAFLKVLRNSAAYSHVMDTKGALMARREFQKPVSRVDQSYKDFSLMLEYSAALGQQLPFAQVYTELLHDCIEQGEAQCDNAAILAAIARRGGG
ncbi:MAG TPA: NAD(P)-dependent oxidoreductase [Burkholderiales bacterium]|nr:NAD(P)-dependent oxidoreductase [Burkholderiales bacterium]